ncbi:hypothetical protein COCNU_scaffold005577G000010 [Cocos nucifera]|nr:hypothetical protein [Cocos nucifera]
MDLAIRRAQRRTSALLQRAQSCLGTGEEDQSRYGIAREKPSGSQGRRSARDAQACEREVRLQGARAERKRLEALRIASRSALGEDHQGSGSREGHRTGRCRGWGSLPSRNAPRSNNAKAKSIYEILIKSIYGFHNKLIMEGNLKRKKRSNNAKAKSIYEILIKSIYGFHNKLIMEGNLKRKKRLALTLEFIVKKVEIKVKIAFEGEVHAF